MDDLKNDKPAAKITLTSPEPNLTDEQGNKIFTVARGMLSGYQIRIRPNVKGQKRPLDEAEVRGEIPPPKIIYFNEIDQDGKAIIVRSEGDNPVYYRCFNTGGLYLSGGSLDSLWMMKKIDSGSSGYKAKLVAKPAVILSSQRPLTALPYPEWLPQNHMITLTNAAKKLSEIKCFGEITPKGLWELAGSYSPAEAIKSHLGDAKYCSLPAEQKHSLMNLLKNAKTCYKKATTQLASLAKPLPEPPLSISKLATGGSLSTKTDTDAALPLPSIVSQALVPPNRAVQALPIIRATLTNPHKNRCFINSVMHYLRATLPTEDVVRLRSVVSEQGSAVNAVAQLFETMERCESGYDLKRNEVTNKLDELVIACLKNDNFHGCVQVQETRQSRHARPQKGRLQQLKGLAHDDAADFYMAIWSLLKSQLPSMNQVKLYQEMRVNDGTVEFIKSTLAAAQSEPFIALKFAEGDSIQSAVDHFFAESEPTLISWTEEDVITGSDATVCIQPGNYDSGVTYRLIVGTQFQVLNFRFEMQGLQKEGQGKLESICKTVQEKILTPIRIPIEYAATGERRKMTATPCCIVAHQGSDHDSGHYVTLENTQGGWLLHDDGQPARILPDLQQYLKGPQQFTPYLIAYDVT